MANSNFVTNTSVFTPFTYEEIAAPLREQTQLQMAIEDAYSQLGQNAGAVAALLNPQNDSRSYNQYMNYMNALGDQAGAIAREGLTPRSRAALMDLNSRYATDIIPIQKAYENRAAEIKRAQEISDKDPTRLLSYNPSQKSVDEYLSNPNMSFESKSGALLAEEVAQQVAPLSKILTDYGNGKPLDRYTKTWLENHGLTVEQVQAAISNPNDPGVLQGIVNRVIESSGIDNWGDPDISMMARYYAQQGLWQGIGASNVHTYDDYGARQALQDYYTTRRAKASGSDDSSAINNPWRQHVYATPNNKKTAKIQGDLSALNDMMNGRIEISPKEVARMAKDNGMNVDDILNKDGSFKDGVMDLFDKIQQTGVLNTELELNLADYGLMADTLLRAVNIRTTKGLDSGFKEDGREKYSKDSDIKKFINSDMTITYTPSGGLFLVGQDKDGNTKRFNMNPDLLSGLRVITNSGEVDVPSMIQTMRDDQMRAISQGDYNKSNEIAYDLGMFIYSAINTKLKSQSKSDSKL